MAQEAEPFSGACVEGVVGVDTTDVEGENLDGIRVGGGVEMAIATNAYAKAEYRYSDYEQGFDLHQLVGGIGLRFWPATELWEGPEQRWSGPFSSQSTGGRCAGRYNLSFEPVMRACRGNR